MALESFASGIAHNSLLMFVSGLRITVGGALGVVVTSHLLELETDVTVAGEGW